MRISTNIGIYLYDLTDAKVCQIEQKFSSLIDYCDSEGPNNNFLFMEHLTLKQSKEVKKWLEKTLNVKISTNIGISLYDLTDVKVCQVEQKFSNFIDYRDLEGPNNNFLFMEHLTLKQFKKVKKWLEKTFNVKIKMVRKDL